MSKLILLPSPIMSKNWQNFWLRHAAVSSPRHLERKLKSGLHKGFRELLNGVVQKKHRPLSNVELSPFK